MKTIINLFTRVKDAPTIMWQVLLQKDAKKILGRWNIETCDKKLNNKIDLSNEDHCGPCGQYMLDKSQRDIPVKK